MQAKITINHVLSHDVHSGIFNDIIGYFDLYGSEKFNYMSSTRPEGGALIRHYHRPNLESSLINPCILTVHHDLFDTDESLEFEKFEKQYRQADHIVCLNTIQKQILADRGIHHTSVVPHGFNTKFLRPIQRAITEKRKITLGLFSRRYGRKVKGEAYLAELVKRLSPEKFSFILVGQDRIIDQAMISKLGFDVKVYEKIPYSVLADLYSEIDFLLVLSKFEGGPANIPEAISTQTPIISTPVGMTVDFIEEWKNGFFLTGNPDIDIVNFNKLYDEPEKTKALFDGAVSCRSKASSWSEIVSKHEEIYAAICSSLFEGKRK